MVHVLKSTDMDSDLTGFILQWGHEYGHNMV